MSDATGDREALRRAVALHLEALRRDGLWGMSTGRFVPGPTGDEATADETAAGGFEAGDESTADGAEARESADRRRPRREASTGGGPEERDPADATPADRRGGDGAAIRREADLFDVVEASASAADASLDEIRPEVEGCTLCRLCETRTNVVFGVGDPDARLMFIGEGPGRDEDLQGDPFVGRAGQLLDRIIAAMGHAREDVYIANAVKCRPPQNRNPRDDELTSCLPYLHRQVAVIRPRVIVLLGRVAVQAVLGLDAPLSRLRGRFQSWRGIDVMCTYHPAYLLRNPSAKRMVWEDMQQVMRRLAGEG